MTDTAPAVGSVSWCDLTVEDAGRLRDFYSDVVGWSAQEVEMGGYADYAMSRPADGTPVAGVCWSRGANKGLPPVWLVYFIVASLDEALARVRAGGGEVLREPSGSGPGTFAVVRDPAGAVCALYEAR